MGKPLPSIPSSFCEALGPSEGRKGVSSPGTTGDVENLCGGGERCREPGRCVHRVLCPPLEAPPPLAHEDPCCMMNLTQSCSLGTTSPWGCIPHISRRMKGRFLHTWSLSFTLKYLTQSVLMGSLHTESLDSGNILPDFRDQDLAWHLVLSRNL